MSFESALAALDNQGGITPPQPNLNHESATVVKSPETTPAVAPVQGEVAQEKKEPPSELTQPPPPKPEEQKQQELASARFAAIAKRERELFQQRKSLAEEKRRVETLQREVEGLRNLREEAKKNPMRALEALGTSYKDLTERYLAGEKDINPTDLAVRELREKIEQTEANREAEKKAHAEAQRVQAERDYQESIQDFKQDIHGFIGSHTDQYELINLNKSQDLVFNTIEAYFQQTQKEGSPKLLSIQEACDLVEGHLEKQVEANLAAKKIKSKFAQPQTDKAKTQTNTLTNNMTSSAPSFLPSKTEQERMARAMAALSK